MSPYFRPLRRLRIYQAVGALLVVALIWLSLAPLGAAPDFPSSDKVGHVLAYFGLTLWFTQIIRRGKPLLLCGAALITLGITLEWAQGFTAYRYTEAADAVANTLGVALGALAGLSPLGNVLARLEHGRTPPL